MSGLFAQINPLAEMVFATRGPNTWATFGLCQCNLRVFTRLDPIDQSIYSFLQVRLPTHCGSYFPARHLGTIFIRRQLQVADCKHHPRS
jgi:hypothetical protein